MTIQEAINHLSFSMWGRTFQHNNKKWFIVDKEEGLVKGFIDGPIESVAILDEKDISSYIGRSLVKVQAQDVCTRHNGWLSIDSTDNLHLMQFLKEHRELMKEQAKLFADDVNLQRKIVAVQKNLSDVEQSLAWF